MNSKYIYEAPELLKDFLGYMQNIKGKSQKTVDEYYLDLRTFLRYIKILKKKVDREIEFSKIPIDDIDINLIKTITLSDILLWIILLTNATTAQKHARAKPQV